MGDVEIPTWLKGLPLAPEYRPTETEFADPIAYISRIEKEASAFGICKVVPPLPKPSKKFVLSNLNKSLSRCPELGSEAPACSSSQMSLWDKGNGDELRAVFTTRHQELGQGVKRLRGPVPIQMQVWQSGEMYTLDQFESKSKAFARNHLSGIKDVSPLVIESLFWKAASEKPVYVEYANDVPGSGFGEPEEPFQHFYRRKRRRKVNQKLQERTACDEPNMVPTMDDSPNKSVSLPSSSNLSSEDLPSMSRQKSFNLSSNDMEGTAGWKISNSPWNLQVIARSRGSLTRFMPDDIPGVTSPMVYIGMLFSWFAWHVEDHELHSLNFLHMGAPKTWYAIPGEYAFALEEVIRMKGYGGHLDRLAALTLLGEKTSLLSPEVVIESGIPCCRLVQNPGEFVVTFPRAYHIGFSHGFNCGEAANFATPQWLKVAKEAAIRRAAMNFLPMLSHQQLLYILTMSFVSRVPRALLPGVRSSRSKDRKKEERELLVKKAFIDDVVNENYLLRALLGKDFSFHAVLWDPELLPSPSNGSSSARPPVSHEASGIGFGESNTGEGSYVGHASEDTTALETSHGNTHFEKPNIRINKVDGQLMYIEAMDYLCEDDDDLPCGLHVDSGTLACVACGVLGFPFMSIVQPSNRASEEIFPEELRSMNPSSQSCADNTLKNSDSDMIKETCMNGRPFEDQSGNSSARCTEHTPVATEFPTDGSSLNNSGLESSSSTTGVSSSTVSNKLQKRADLQHLQIGSSSETMGNIDKSNSIHPSTESGESGGSARMEIDAVAKEDFRSTNALLTDFCKETKWSSNRTDVDSGEVNRQWNISNSFLRPRIFCLEHALEIQELLQSKGGANVLIICHSDYPKIKGEAMSIAEEIGVHFNCNNVPLEGASQLDLDLIYISIDDEHDECKEDWTAKLGLNLRNLVKLRKDCPSKQERPALALGGLFSDQVPASDVSSLKWHSRKSRTHHKPGGLSRSKQHGVVDRRKDDMTSRNSDTKAVQENHGDVHLRGPDNEGGPLSQACQSHGCSYARKHHPPEWLASSSTIATKAEQTPDSENNGSVSGKESPIYEKLRNVNIEMKGLAGLNDTTSKNSQVQGERCIRQDDNSTLDGCNSVVLVDVPVLEEISGNSREFSTPVQTSLGGEVCDSAISGPPNIVIGTVVGSEVLHQGILTMMDSSMASDRKDSLTYVCLSPSIDVPTLGNSQMHQEIQATTETTMASNDCSHLKFRDQPIEASETDKMTQTPEENNTASTVCDSAKLYSQHSLSVVVVNGDKIQQEKIGATEETNFVDTATLAGPRTRVENPEKGEINERTTISGGDPIEFSDQSTIAIPCSNMQEVHSTDVCAPARLADIPDIDLSRAESYEMQLGILPTKIATMQSSYDSAKLGLYSISAAAGNSEILQGHQTNVEMKLASELCSLKVGTEQRNAYPILVYSRSGKKQNKRKIEPEKKSYSQDAHGSGFIRSPCEGLRPRTGRKMDGGMIMSYRAPEVKKTAKKAWNAGEHKKSYPCDLDGCRMSFSMKAELQMHKRNRCTHEGCRKRFSSHRYAMHHERVHSEERPLKCSWKGCAMSFKWAWARTEHMRLHTGERPYRCNVVGCGLTFRFVSDFSRHRRKTGHSVN